MNKDIDNIKRVREYLLTIIKDLSVKQLNETPQGFNNNIIWNIAHVIAAQQGVCYLRAGLPLVVEEKYFTQYKPGTKPEQFVDETEINKIKELMFSPLDVLAHDYEKNIFNNYPAWTTRYGTELTSINDALSFLIYHEGLHSGVIMSLKKLVKN